MAKYEDYVKDELDQELEEVEGNAEPTEADEIPERFKGKSAVEIARAYSELEKLNSRQAQDLGALRKSVDTLLELQSQEERTRAEATSKKPVTVDDIYEDPDKTIRKVVKEESQSRIEQLERELQQQRVAAALGEFGKKYPTWQDDVKDPAMLNWIRERPYRLSLAQRADAGDLSAADELFGMYYDTAKKAEKAEQKQERKRKVQAAGLESAGAGVPERVERYSRSALMEKRIRAKQGDHEAERWLDAHAETIRQAYAEGRVDD